MKTYSICPISNNQINERVARINAAFTVLLLLLFGFTGQWFIPAFLATDFFMRSGNLSRFSPVYYSSQNIVKILSLEELLINAGPKIFAARIGLVFSMVILIVSLAELNTVAFGFAIVLGLFSFLEAAFGICVACKIYPFLHRFLYKISI